MDKKNRRTQIRHVFLSGILSLMIVFFGAPLVAAIGVENPLSIACILVLIVGSYSTLYLR